MIPSMDAQVFNFCANQDFLSFCQILESGNACQDAR